jgi:hypothetical protein
MKPGCIIIYRHLVASKNNIGVSNSGVDVKILERNVNQYRFLKCCLFNAKMEYKMTFFGTTLDKVARVHHFQKMLLKEHWTILLIK